mmetsp:Transcript_93703/g.264470  ORF Transcript_93703/g.264470 Transcript_93703/m.264470 type:complete len:219 (+) Transcript_93703:637-1293(+)
MPQRRVAQPCNPASVLIELRIVNAVDCESTDKTAVGVEREETAPTTDVVESTPELRLRVEVAGPFANVVVVALVTAAEGAAARGDSPRNEARDPRAHERLRPFGLRRNEHDHRAHQRPDLLVRRPGGKGASQAECREDAWRAMGRACRDDSSQKCDRGKDPAGNDEHVGDHSSHEGLVANRGRRALRRCRHQHLPSQSLQPAGRRSRLAIQTRGHCVR